MHTHITLSVEENLSLYSVKHQPMKTYGGVVLWLHHSCPVRWTEVSGLLLAHTHCIGSSLGPAADLNTTARGPSLYRLRQFACYLVYVLRKYVHLE
jgi:hypothetical protein